jgi:hypothetical protein
MGVTVFIEDVSSLENKYRGVFPPHLHYFLIFLGEFRHDESMCRRGLGGMFNFVRASFKLKCYERNLRRNKAACKGMRGACGTATDQIVNKVQQQQHR